MIELTPEILLRAYTIGIFPMAESAGSDELFWLDPEIRGILPLDTFYVPRRLRRTVRRSSFQVTIDQAFGQVLVGCAKPTPNRPKTWINEAILDAYTALFNRGFAHSVEVWDETRLVGGLYGVSIGGAFFGESMFQTETDASKIALIHLVGRLITAGYKLLDTQFVTEHLSQFGAIEIPRSQYKALLTNALDIDADFYSPSADDALSAILQSTTHTS
ncbi:MAG: leucyl/phenylalanyl-tRNA--protein transferase [Pseudomonadota bacterium]